MRPEKTPGKLSRASYRTHFPYAIMRTIYNHSQTEFRSGSEIAMLLTGQPQVREVALFPQLKEKG